MVAVLQKASWKIGAITFGTHYQELEICAWIAMFYASISTFIDTPIWVRLRVINVRQRSAPSGWQQNYGLEEWKQLTTSIKSLHKIIKLINKEYVEARVTLERMPEKQQICFTVCPLFHPITREDCVSYSGNTSPWITQWNYQQDTAQRLNLCPMKTVTAESPVTLTWRSKIRLHSHFQVRGCTSAVGLRGWPQHQILPLQSHITHKWGLIHVRS